MGKDNLRQRKKPTSNDGRKDEDLEFLNQEATKAANQQAASKNILAVVGILVAAGVAAMFFWGNSTTNSSNQTDDSRKLNEDYEDMPITRVVKDFKVLKKIPHDPRSFTQGLMFLPDQPNILYESTGMYNESKIKKLDLAQHGSVVQQYAIPLHMFGEGMAYFPLPNNGTPRLIHLTWKEETGFICDVDTLEIMEEFKFETTTMQGWGITYRNTRDGGEFIVSDGSAYLHFWDADNYRETSKIEVKLLTQDMIDQGAEPQKMKLLNELEFDSQTNTVLANVWFQDIIARINPDTGYVTTIYDLRSLYTDRQPKADVFNGIALNSNGEMWVTGKYWPYMYQIELGE